MTACSAPYEPHCRSHPKLQHGVWHGDRHPPGQTSQICDQTLLTALRPVTSGKDIAQNKDEQVTPRWTAADYVGGTRGASPMAWPCAGVTAGSGGSTGARRCHEPRDIIF